MKFRILGPLELDAGEGPVTLGGRKQRAVLAHLLIRANQVVPASTLIDELWGDEPPETARNTLQTYVSHLRKVVGADRISARPPGYSLEIRAEELDASRFEAIVHEATKARPTDVGLAGSLFEEAIELWRGPALADVLDDSSLMVEAARLNELRLVAEEGHLEALLELGAHSIAVGQVEALLARNPLREAFWAQLMLALYRSGRQAEALAAYGRAREILADELGIDPSPELSRLQERILKQDQNLELRGQPLRGYRLLERMGEGGLGVVFRGIQPKVGREVAVKITHQRVAADPSFIRRFEPEAQAVAALEHPHIVPMYDYWREPEGAYVVSRYLSGGSLAGIEARGEVLGQEQAGRVVDHIGSALAYAHRSGVAHGNLKPSNILLDPDGNVYLADFRIGIGAPPDPLEDLKAFEAIAARLLPQRTTATGLSDAAESAEPHSRLVPRNPYKGLRAFAESDAADFFGRTALVGRIVARLSEHDQGSRFLALVGPSGCGKSSVVRAGLLPAIRSGALAGSEGWFVTEMFPGVNPMEELESALLRIAPRPVPHLLDALEGGPRGLLGAADLVAPGDAQILVVIDQFEELFTLTADQTTRERLLESLRVAAVDPLSRFRVIVTLRGDFYDRPLAYARFGDLLGTRTEVVPPLNPDELELAITGPARQVGISTEPGLSAELIADVSHQAGALPLLQYALTELFERQEEGRLTLASYREIGGVAGALSARAERLYGSSHPASKRATKQLFLRLVTLGEGRKDTRRRVTKSELATLDVDHDELERVLATFGRHRLFTFDREPSTREPTVEIAHEALLDAWDRLRGWIDEARDDLRQEQRLDRAAAEWRASDRDPSFLLQGARLEQFETWSGTTPLAVGTPVREYIEASVKHRSQQSAEEEARRYQVAHLERRSVRRLRSLVVVLTVAALVASGLTRVVVGQRASAVRSERIATARELAAAAMANLGVDPQRSLLLALQAVQTTGDSGVLIEAAQALHSAVAANRELLRLSDPSTANVAYSPDGRLLATGGTAGGFAANALVIWDAATGKKLYTLDGHLGDIGYVAFGPDSSRVVSSAPGGLIVWDTATRRQLLRLDGPGFAGAVATFSPDGSRLVVGASQSVAHGNVVNVVRIVNATTGRDLRPPLPANYNLCQAPVFSRDGSLIAAPGHDGVPIWDSKTGRLLQLLPQDACTVAFSPSGARLIAAGDGGAAVWDVRTGHQEFPLLGQTHLIGADWSPDGSRLATGGRDGSARIWDAATGEQQLVLLGTAGLVANVAFSPEGTRLLTGGGDGTARVWDITRAGSAEVIGYAEPNAINNVAYSPDGSRLLITAPGTGSALLDASTGRVIRRFPQAQYDAAFSPDGTAVAIVGNGPDSIIDASTGKVKQALDPHAGYPLAYSPDGTSIGTGYGLWTAIWDATTGKLRRAYSDKQSDQIIDVAISPDGKLFAGVSGYATVHVWDVVSGRQMLNFQAQTGLANALAFSPNGTMLAISGGGGTTLWRIPSGERIVTLGSTGSDKAVAFSSDGKLVATGGYDGTSRVWEVATGQEILSLPGHTDSLTGVAFSPDGTRLASSSLDGTLRVYVLPITDLVRIARARLTRGFTDLECRQYLHVPSCPAA